MQFVQFIALLETSNSFMQLIGRLAIPLCPTTQPCSTFRIHTEIVIATIEGSLFHPTTIPRMHDLGWTERQGEQEGREEQVRINRASKCKQRQLNRRCGSDPASGQRERSLLFVTCGTEDSDARSKELCCFVAIVMDHSHVALNRASG